MSQESSALHWSGLSESLRIRFPLVGLVEAMLGPCLAVLMLVVCVRLLGGHFNRHYAALAVLTFLLLYPGLLRVTENRRRMAFKGSVAWVTVCVTLLIFGAASGYLYYFDLRVILLWQVGTLGVLLLAHELARQMLERLVASNKQSAVIVGANETSERLSAYFTCNRYSGVVFRGYFDDRDRARIGGHLREFPLLGNVSELADFVRSNRIELIYIALPMASQPRILTLLDDLKDTTASIFFAPDVFVTELIQARVEQVGETPVVAVCESPFTGLNGVVKRASDIVIAGLILAAISPVLLACAIAVRISSPGPIIFKQRRYGLDGKEVLVYKFRSMTTTDNGSVVKQATRNDARITRVGAFLRRTSLDELPQFINVLQGRMSVVGPRPHAVAHNEQYRKLIKGYMVRHKVRPGITGWAQVNGARGETDTLDKMARRIRLDLHYLRNWSLLLDLKIILRTVGLMAKDTSAY